MVEPTTVAIVPHTHWDREWYSPFQTFRIRLVRLLDELLPLLESDLAYARFLLDGQTAVLDDYLEIRPEAAAPLTRLAASQRLSIGPWMILMDEFMVSGETIVRDLQMGIRRATEFGGPMEIGYLPDMFGHVAEMPQILRSAGLEHAVVWRGVPSEVTQGAFWWESPDGSRVRAEYLYGSYSNGRDLPDDAKQLIGRARSYEVEIGDARVPGSGLLLMNGTDHQMPQPWLGRIVAEANAVQDEYRFVVTSLPEYLADQPSEGLRTWRGELRSGARANVLMGVASNRVDVHQKCAAAERAIERRAEPLCATLLPPERYPDRLLHAAWRLLVLNSAHDSSCACSADEVVDAVTVRYEEARQIGDGLARDALATLATRVDAPRGATVVANPSAGDRGGLIGFRIPGDGPLHLRALDDGTLVPAQVVETLGGVGFATTVTPDQTFLLADMMRGPELAGANITSYELDRSPEGATLVCVGAGVDDPVVDLSELRDEVVALGAAGVTIAVRVMRAPRREVVARVEAVPGFGWRTFEAVDGPGPAGGVTTTEHSLENEHLRVEVDPHSGTYAVTTSDGVTAAGLGRLVEGGDGGDTYNYSPPTADLVIEHPEAVAVTLHEEGPVRAQLRVLTWYRWPQHAVGDERRCTHRSDEQILTEVVTTLELRSGEPFLRVRTELDHRCRDHRLRAHFPLPRPVTQSHADCAFAVVARGLTTEGGPHEAPLPTFVSRRFVDASDGEEGLALIHDGLLEYELVDDGRELALTLLRATGYLSRSEMMLRPNPAGPLDPLDGPQLQGPVAVDYAVALHRGDWAAARLPALADDVLVPLERVRVAGRGTEPVTHRPLAVRGAVVSALLREPGGRVVRVYNPGSAETEVEVEVDETPARGWLVDLRGRPLERFEGSFALRGGGIATARLDD
ncbi:MAG: glycoside hydrolase family 38 N-terminal domain-containing protein [Acidimicrobiia bacterium]